MTGRAKGKGLRFNYGRAYRRAQRKRILQKVCLANGVSRVVAMQIAAEFLGKNVFTSSGNAPK